MRKTVCVPMCLLLAAAALSGCSGGGSSTQNRYASVCKSYVSGASLVGIAPDQGTMFGDQRVTAVVQGLASSFTPVAVYLGNKARGFTAAPQSGGGLTVSFTTAGTPTPGTYPLVLVSGAGMCASVPNAYTYQPPVSGAFRVFVGYGASGTAGFQSASYNEDAQLHGPAAWVARQAGAYFPIPLFKVPGIPPAPWFDALSPAGSFTGSVLDIVPYLLGTKNLPDLFEDPTVAPYNIAIPGASVEDEVLGPASRTLMSIPIVVLSNLLFVPFDNDLYETKDVQPEVRMVKALHPTLIMSMDLYINDLISNEVPTTYDTFVAYITQDVSALAATGAQVFLADVPDAVLLLPSAQQAALSQLTPCSMTFSDITGGVPALDEAASADRCAAAFSSGTVTPASTCAYNACETLVPMDEKVNQFNGEFYTVAARYSNVHVVPLADAMSGKATIEGYSMTVDAQGFPEYVIGDVPVKVRHLGGFSSLDDTHPTNTGYAIIAALFVQAINATLDAHVPPIDLASAIAGDPLSPPALQSYCSLPANSQKPYCQCISGTYSSVTAFTCNGTILY